MFEIYKKEEEINFELFDKDYLSVFEVFSQTSQLPFGLEKELNKSVDVRKFQEKPGGAGANQNKRYPYKPQGQNAGKEPWVKGTGKAAAGGDGEDEEEGDPEWIEFDPEKQRDKFFGHVMADEQRLREQVVRRNAEKEREHKERQAR